MAARNPARGFRRRRARPPGPGRSRPGRGRCGKAASASPSWPHGAATGAAATIVTGSEPGLLLGLFLVAATIVAALVVATRAAYVIIPVPSLAYTAAALLAGYLHDRAAVDTSLTGLAVNAVQWIAGGFFAMTSATLIAIVVAAGRWMFIGPGTRRAYRQPRGRAPRYEPWRHDSR